MLPPKTTEIQGRLSGHGPQEPDPNFGPSPPTCLVENLEPGESNSWRRILEAMCRLSRALARQTLVSCSVTTTFQITHFSFPQNNFPLFLTPHNPLPPRPLPSKLGGKRILPRSRQHGPTSTPPASATTRWKHVKPCHSGARPNGRKLTIFTRINFSPTTAASHCVPPLPSAPTPCPLDRSLSRGPRVASVERLCPPVGVHRPRVRVPELRLAEGGLPLRRLWLRQMDRFGRAAGGLKQRRRNGIRAVK
jgi:hypothetical protein